MEDWRRCWRHGFATQMDDEELLALARALEADDRALIQGGTTLPPPLLGVDDWEVEGACPAALPIWRVAGLAYVGDVQAEFGLRCADADRRLGEAGACRHFLRWVDESPRDVMRRDLLSEVRLALAERRAGAESAG